MKLKNKFILLLSTILLFASNTDAYESDTSKVPLLNIAMDIYTQCFPYESIYDRNNDARERVLEGYIALDKGLGFSFHNTFSLNRSEVFSSRESILKKSDITLWNDLKTGLDENSNEYNKLLFIGGLLNVLEELSAPIDVTSVLEGIGPDINRLNNALGHNNMVCNDTEMNTETFEDIRNNTLQMTTNLLNDDIPQCQGVTWEELLLSPNSNSACNLKKNDPRFKEFVYKLHFNAVNAKLKLLNWSKKNIPNW